MADGAQHRQVARAVRVGPRLGEVDAALRSQLAHPHRLALAVAERPVEAPGVEAVALLELRARRAVEEQDVGEHLGGPLRRRRDDEHRAPGVLMLVGGLEHLRVQPRQDARQHHRAQPLDVRDAPILEERADAVAHDDGPLVGRASQPELDVLHGVTGELPARRQTRAARRTGPVEAGRAGHERSVEVEEDARRHWGGTRRITASPCPPPEQIAAQPSPPPRRRNSWTRTPRMRAPDAPIGWPSATAPPLTLTLSSSMPRSLIELSVTEANASLISHRSMSDACSPAFSSAFFAADAGVVAR